MRSLKNRLAGSCEPPSRILSSTRRTPAAVCDEDALRIGSRVCHGTFGVGTVKGLAGAGEQRHRRPET